MRDHIDDPDQGRYSVAIAAWENEGGAVGADSMDNQFGRRVEMDRSWTIYHVFTGRPATADGEPLIGLTHSDATRRMIFLNRRNLERRKARTASRPLSPHA